MQELQSLDTVLKSRVKTKRRNGEDLMIQARCVARYGTIMVILPGLHETSIFLITPSLASMITGVPGMSLEKHARAVS
jgi:hypothetical protein